MTKKMIADSFREARATGKPVVMANGWSAIVGRVRNMPRGGPMAAWDYIYDICRPDGFKHQLGKGQAAAVEFAARIMNK
jgi:hypothetical protein